MTTCTQKLWFWMMRKKESPYEFTLVSELANDTIGYIPVAKAFEEGGYEPTSSVVTPDAGSKLAKASIDLVKSL